jgi:GT2 family glycosyltransferase
MPRLVVDLELTALPSELVIPEGASGLVGLVRLRGRPAGIFRLRATGRVSARTLERAVAEQVGVPEEIPRPPAARPVSIAVCTRDRPDELALCLESLRAHAASGHDVLVVDNAPSDDRARSLAAAFPVRYVREPRPGLDCARNRALSEARHELVAFTDDDCVADAGWIDALVAPYADPGATAVTGLVMPLELRTPAQESFEAYCASRRRFAPMVFRRGTTPPSAAGAAGLGANMSVRRRRMLELGGFDERFDGGRPTLSGGDTDAFARILAAGGTIVYRPDALVWHRHRADLEAVRKVVFGYGVGVFAFLTKRLVEDRDLGVISTAPRWLLGPPVKAAWNALRGRPATPAHLVWAELQGALSGPSRYRAARREPGAAGATR